MHDQYITFSKFYLQQVQKLLDVNTPHAEVKNYIEQTSTLGRYCPQDFNTITLPSDIIESFEHSDTLKRLVKFLLRRLYLREKFSHRTLWERLHPYLSMVLFWSGFATLCWFLFT